MKRLHFSHSISLWILLPVAIAGCQKNEYYFTCGDDIALENRLYQTIRAGDQCWFRTNLNVGKRIPGKSNQEVSNLILEKYCYNDLETNCDSYGGLYQWDEMMQGDGSPDAQGICPDGWHIPSDAEWSRLFDWLGGREKAGRLLKSAQGWYGGGNGLDSIRFTALPGGDRDIDGTFLNLMKTAVYWSSSPYDLTYSWSHKMGYQHNDVYHNHYNRESGFSVRCVKEIE